MTGVLQGSQERWEPCAGDSPFTVLLPLCDSFRWESLVSQAADIGQALLLCGGPWGRRMRALPNETFYTDVCQINAKDHKAIAMEF